jgi:hypothetical protein
VNGLTQWTYGDLPWTEAKLAGETAVRDLYKSKAKGQEYVVVRPAAALVNKPPIPVDHLVVMQGDVYSSAQHISRNNVANVVVSALLNGHATDSCTFEVAPAFRLYKNDQGNFFDLLCLPTKNQSNNHLDLPQALVHRNAASYDELLDGLVTDDEMKRDYGFVLHDGRKREDVPSLERLAHAT